MKSLTVEDLRSLIRLIPPLRALRDDVEQSLHLETFEGTGDLAVRSFQGLQASIVRITEDPYVEALTLDIVDGMKDKHKLSQVMLASGQLLAYLEGQTGVNSMRHGRPPMHAQRPDLHGVADVIKRVVVPPAPPVPPAPHAPPVPPAPPDVVWFMRHHEENDKDDRV
jgi:hypothetical protein